VLIGPLPLRTLNNANGAVGGSDHVTVFFPLPKTGIGGPTGPTLNYIHRYDYFQRRDECGPEMINIKPGLRSNKLAASESRILVAAQASVGSITSNFVLNRIQAQIVEVQN
jgi:hypothetical protein